MPSQGARDAFDPGTSSLVDLLKSTSDLNQIVETPFGPMPIANFVMFPTLGIVIHRWGLAKGTGQGTSIDSGLAEVCYQVLAASPRAG